MQKFAIVLTGALASALILSGAAYAQTAPTPAPTTLPYPAYGTPAPGIAVQRPKAGVPQSVTLQQAIAIAAATSPQLAIARAQLMQAHAPLSLANTAIFPNISGTVSTTRSNGGRQSNGAVGGGFTSNSLSADLRQLIYDGGRVIAQIHSARANYNSATGTYERTLQTVAFNVATAYYNTLQAQQATLLAQQVVHQNEVQEALVNAQLRAGTASRVDLATAQLPVAQARVSLVNAQGAELQADAAFANSLGLDADTLVRPVNDASANSTKTILQAQPASYDTAVARALLLRPDYLAAQASVTAEEYNLQATKAQLFPSISGTASYGTSSTLANGSDFRPSNSVGVTMSIPIFDQGVTRAQTEQATGLLNQAQAQLQNAKLGVELNVQQTLVNFVSAQAAVTQAKAELSKAQEILRATQAQYRAGVTTLPLLLNAQVGLTQAQTDELNAVYGLRQAEQSYLYALGEIAMGPGTP
jgi:outer membrane protein TolC